APPASDHGGGIRGTSAGGVGGNAADALPRQRGRSEADARRLRPRIPRRRERQHVVELEPFHPRSRRRRLLPVRRDVLVPDPQRRLRRCPGAVRSPPRGALAADVSFRVAQTLLSVRLGGLRFKAQIARGPKHRRECLCHTWPVQCAAHMADAPKKSLFDKLKRGLFMTHTEIIEKEKESLTPDLPNDKSAIDGP